MKINMYCSMHPDVTVQKGLFNRDYRYAADLFRDRLKAPVDKYVSLTGMQIMWSHDTIYYNDPSLTPFIDAIMSRAKFRTVALEKEVLKADPDWKLLHQYRVLFPPNLNLDPNQVENDKIVGEILAITWGRRYDADGNVVEMRRVVGFLSDCADSAALLKMKYKDVIFEAAS